MKHFPVPAILLCLALFGCGQDTTVSPDNTTPQCTVCLVYYSGAHPSFSVRPWVTLLKLWQTDNGTHVDACDINTPRPVDWVCDEAQLDCECPVYEILDTTYWCE